MNSIRPLNFSQFVHSVLAPSFMRGNVYEGEYEVVESQKNNNAFASIAVIVSVAEKSYPLDAFGNFSKTKTVFSEFSILSVNCEIDDFLQDLDVADIEGHFVITSQKTLVQVINVDSEGKNHLALEVGSGIKVRNGEITVVSKAEMSGS